MSLYDGHYDYVADTCLYCNVVFLRPVRIWTCRQCRPCLQNFEDTVKTFDGRNNYLVRQVFQYPGKDPHFTMW